MKNLINFYLPFILVVLSFQVFGQKNNHLPTQYKTKFAQLNSLIIIEATVNDVRGNYIIDTGTPGLVLNSKDINDLDVLSPYQSISKIRSRIGRRIARLKIGPWEQRYFQATLMDFTHLEVMFGRPIAGLLGAQCLRNFEIEINYFDHTIEFKSYINKASL